MDLLSVLPDFPTRLYAHIIPPLERSHISTVDLITLDPLEIAKRAHVPPADVRRLTTQLVRALHHDIGFEDEPSPEEPPSSSLNADAPLVPGPTTALDLSRWSAISTLDPALDALLGGGVPTGYLTEVTGERYVGATSSIFDTGNSGTAIEYTDSRTVEVERPSSSSVSSYPSSSRAPAA